MNVQDKQRRGSVADEAARYLEAVELFASLEADPHGDARARAASDRACEALRTHAGRPARKGV